MLVVRDAPATAAAAEGSLSYETNLQRHSVPIVGKLSYMAVEVQAGFSE